MALEAPFPELGELLAAIGEAGRRVSNIRASEGAAGNDSVSSWCPPPMPRANFLIPTRCRLSVQHITLLLLRNCRICICAFYRGYML